MNKAITSRNSDYAQWYNDLVIKSGLAEYSAVRGCMVIKPHGFALWENIKNQLDVMFKETGHQNAYFPLFIPKSFLSKEAAHVEGFAKECAVVTHYRLINDPNGNGLVVDPEAKLEEELIVRPTSETIIWNSFKQWIKSYRDLPILINQWANVVRWEMRTRLFLRTTEFLWQEGHTAHRTQQEAEAEAQTMLGVYAQFVEEWMALPVIRGTKTASERFSGADETYCIEAMMQDGKALQAGTAHFLGQNFAKAFEVQFTNEQNKLEYVWATSWGVSTRLIGAVIMAHSDDDGLVLPPKLAPIQVVVVAIYKTPEEKATLHQTIEPILKQLKAAHIRVLYDDDNHVRPGAKYAEYELKGVPIRLSVGSKEVESQSFEMVRRDTKEKTTLPFQNCVAAILQQLEAMQTNMFNKAYSFLQTHITRVDTWADFQSVLDNKTGFVSAHWDGSAETEAAIKTATKATIRCIPLENKQEKGICVFSGNPSTQRVLFARSY